MGFSWFGNFITNTCVRSASVLTIIIPQSKSEWPPKYLVPVTDQDVINGHVVLEMKITVPE